MSALPDKWIREMARKHGMIEPYTDQRKRAGKISFGASSYGYDFRLAREFKIPEFDSAKNKYRAQRKSDFPAYNRGAA